MRRQPVRVILIVLGLGSPVLVAVGVGSCTYALFFYTPDWGAPELLEEVGELRPDQVTSAVLRRPDQDPIWFPDDLLPELLLRVSQSPDTDSIGDVSPWHRFCVVEIEAEILEPFTIEVATRESLEGRPMVIVSDQRSNNPRIGFYDGRRFFEWMESQGLCARVRAPWE